MIKLRLHEDLYGKGYSEAPALPYDASLFTIQLALLMQYVKWDAATIIGFSMVSIKSLNHMSEHSDEPNLDIVRVEV